MTEVTDEAIINSLKEKITPELEKLQNDPELTLANNDKAFGYWVVENLLEDMDRSAAEIGVDGNEHGVDIFDINEEEKRITIVQVKWSDDIIHSIPAGDISRLSDAPTYLYGGLGGNKIFEQKSKEFKEKIESGEKYKIELVLVVAGKLTEPQLTEIDAKKQNQKVQIGGKFFDVNYQAWDRTIIYQRLVHPKTEQITLDSEKVMEYKHGIRNTAFFIVKGKELNLKLKKEQYQPIFELNPRFYLGKGGEKSINNKLAKTAKDDNEAKNFLEYNNGITCLCEDFEVKEVKGKWEERQGEKVFIEDENGQEIVNKLIIENLKIVNGCQSIISLGECKDEVSENVNVLLKLYKIDEDDIKLKEAIYRYTNSQNRLSDRDLASDQQNQIKIQESINAINAGFFWRRKSGEELFYESDPSWKRRHSPRDLRLVDNLKCAKFAYAYNYQKPFESVMIKTTDLFDNNENVFDEIWNDLDPQQFIFAQIIEYCRKKTFTELKKDVQREQSDKKWVETYQHTENIENLENDYFKHSCLAIFNEQIEKHAKSSEIKQAIMKIFHKDAKIKDNNTMKSLSINKQLEKIIPVFAYWILRLDVAVSDKLLDNNQASHMDKTDVQPKFEKSDVFEKLKKKVQSDVEGGGQTEKDIIDKLFQEIIDQANGLNVNPFSSTFQFKI